MRILVRYWLAALAIAFWAPAMAGGGAPHVHPAKADACKPVADVEATVAIWSAETDILVQRIAGDNARRAIRHLNADVEPRTNWTGDALIVVEFPSLGVARIAIVDDGAVCHGLGLPAPQWMDIWRRSAALAM